LLLLLLLLLRWLVAAPMIKYGCIVVVTIGF